MVLNRHDIFFQYITGEVVSHGMYARQEGCALLYLCAHKIQMQLIFYEHG